MKTALCLYGIIGGKKGKNGRGGIVNFLECRDWYLKNIIEVNDCDIFLHSWSFEHGSSLVKAYSPKASRFEPVQKFHILNKKPSLRFSEANSRSRWLSHKTVMQLKSEHEAREGFKYDFVMVSRYDLIFKSIFDFSTLDPSYFYVSNWNDHQRKTPLKNNFTPKSHRFQDLWFVASSEMMDAFSDLYDHLNEYIPQRCYKGLDNHTYVYWHLNKKFGNADEIVRYKFYRWYDYELYRVVHGHTAY